MKHMVNHRYAGKKTLPGSHIDEGARQARHGDTRDEC
jgi:hypothetical protein